MTKNITITIEGYQPGTEEEPIIQSYCGTCHLHQDKYYIQYDEVMEEEGSIRNLMKLSLTQIEMAKKGGAVSQLSFDISKETDAVYHTPYGNLSFQVRTDGIQLEESENQIEVVLTYALYSADSHISDHRTIIRIVPQQEEAANSFPCHE